MESPATTFEHQSSEGKLHHTSPLETLVRRTSSRRHAGHNQRGRNDVRQATAAVPLPIPHFPVPRPSLDSPPRPFASQSMPDSPLLHSTFRSSTASATTNASVLQYYMGQHSKSSIDEPDEAYYYDDNSLVYGEREPPHILWSRAQSTNRTQPNPAPQMSKNSSQPVVPSATDRQDSPEAEPRTSSSTVPTPITTHSPSPNPPNSKPNLRSDNAPSTQSQTPFDYLQLGIQYHESNRLKDSAWYFEKSATEQGGCGVGMLMWGLALRHGWGCKKDEKCGFKWLAKAAESAVADLERARQGRGFDAKAVKEELVIAIYEVGQCFFQGWGVRKDQKMAVSYYRVAANLGDVDAQQDLAFCLANGKGCKKDKKEAAKWYRVAVRIVYILDKYKG
ncbi:hypothetical protein EV401DRAFT_1585708 [Pisolithus croceorrhizus]|nr:hypothetical protein EV401DRAFT_1585708 [Pisolithus croceorrhizus]